VSPKQRAPFVALTALIRQRHPEVPDASAIIVTSRVVVNGAIVSNPASRVRADASVRIVPAAPLRGARKLRGALDALSVPVAGAVALDLGAAAGGFTQILLDRGAARVYAVDAGWGQLRGHLRSDPRVVNLERTNLGRLGPDLVPEPVDVVTMDLSYLAVADALPQLNRDLLARDVELVVLVKPTYELRSPDLASDPRRVGEAVRVVAAAMARQGWSVVGQVPSSVTGSRGAVEVFIHGRLTDRTSPPGGGGW
jgi:23S rRNA (cytidine1920-2'-O)/16S rRNA (cytidine1409-2'-O)-methyltransferase